MLYFGFAETIEFYYWQLKGVFALANLTILVRTGLCGLRHLYSIVITPDSVVKQTITVLASYCSIKVTFFFFYHRKNVEQCSQE